MREWRWGCGRGAAPAVLDLRNLQLLAGAPQAALGQAQRVETRVDALQTAKYRSPSAPEREGAAAHKRAAGAAEAMAEVANGGEARLHGILLIAAGRLHPSHADGEDGVHGNQVEGNLQRTPTFRAACATRGVLPARAPSWGNNKRSVGMQATRTGLPK